MCLDEPPPWLRCREARYGPLAVNLAAESVLPSLRLFRVGGTIFETERGPKAHYDPMRDNLIGGPLRRKVRSGGWWRDEALAPWVRREAR